MDRSSFDIFSAIDSRWLFMEIRMIWQCPWSSWSSREKNRFGRPSHERQSREFLSTLLSFSINKIKLKWRQSLCFFPSFFLSFSLFFHQSCLRWSKTKMKKKSVVVASASASAGRIFSSSSSSSLDNDRCHSMTPINERAYARLQLQREESTTVEKQTPDDNNHWSILARSNVVVVCSCYD